MEWGISLRYMDENIAFDSSDFCNSPSRFTPEARKAHQALADLLDKTAEQKTPHRHLYAMAAPAEASA